MTITAVVIATVAYIVNQPNAAAGGVTSVTLTGAATGEPPHVGRPAADFRATTVDGRPISLSDFKGRPVWLTFGATWCQPCRAENPDISAVYERAKPAALWSSPSSYRKTPARFATTPTVSVSTTRRSRTRPRDRLGVPDRRDPVALLHRRRGRAARTQIGALDQAAMERAIEGIQQ
jgi:thiol-disulfide isomerase/thioredoxin